MSLPPPPPPGSVPPPPGGQFQPPHGYPGPGFQPPAWQEPPVRKRGNGWKWALGAVALLAVIGVTAAVTLSVAGNGDSGDGSPTGTPSAADTASNSDIASANDTGPVAVITEDPSCAAQGPIFATLASDTESWGMRDPAIPATAWTPEVRAQHEAAAKSIRQAADQIVPLAKVTPHRAMRELYEQFIAFGRAYADSIPTYTEIDNQLSFAATNASDAISRICAAIDYGSAAARGPLVAALPAPTQVAPVSDPANPERFLTEPNPICADWDEAMVQFDSDTAAWRSSDPDIPAAQWTPEQKAINDDVAAVMRRFTSQLSALGERSDNPALRDFADLSAQYRRAYLQALPTYTPADKYLANASIRLAGLVASACRVFAN